jgi:hypothetical protein
MLWLSKTYALSAGTYGPVRFGLSNFWSMTMSSAILAGRIHGLCKESFDD